MTPSGPSARQLTELMCGSCSSSVFTARESLRSPRFVATTFSNEPFLKSASVVCDQLLVPTARAGAARTSMQRSAALFMGLLLRVGLGVGLLREVRLRLFRAGAGLRRARRRSGAGTRAGAGIYFRRRFDLDLEFARAAHDAVGRQHLDRRADERRGVAPAGAQHDLP